ncbi:MAG TPA: hypothetical protein VIJ82_15905 [Streptosporangiaceae bacterium]|jgi:hypothetical protein
MITRPGQLLVRHRTGARTPAPAVAALAPAAALVLALSACGGSPADSAAAVRKTCQQVSAVLADGPDPVANPAGHAEAQILPLRQIHAPDRRLRTAIGQLDTAYRQLFASSGRSSAATRAAATATRRIHAICPGAAS